MSNFQTLISQSQNIAIFGHENPDGDAIGGILTLQHLLQKLGKQSQCFTPNSISKIFNFVENTETIKSEFDYGDYDLIIFTDFSPLNRISKFTQHHEQYFADKKLLVIDHHINDGPKEADLVIKDSSAISVCEIIFEQIEKYNPEQLDEKMANRLLLGILTDSGSFHYDEGAESIRVMENTIKLLKLGANKKNIINNFFYKRSLGSVKFANILLERMGNDGAILYTYFENSELESHNIDEEEAKIGYTDIIRKIDGPQIYLLMRKRQKDIKCSLRSGDPETHCGKIAENFGGSGHKGAAGFSIPIEENKTFETQRQNIIQQLKKYIP